VAEYGPKQVALYDRNSQLLSGHVEEGDETTVFFYASGLASGIYFYKLITTNGIITQKMTLLK